MQQFAVPLSELPDIAHIVYTVFLLSSKAMRATMVAATTAAPRRTWHAAHESIPWILMRQSLGRRRSFGGVQHDQISNR